MRKTCFVFSCLFTGAVSAANYGPGFKQTMVPVEGGTLSATVGGKGPTVLLLHGYAETAQMWKPLAVALAPRFTVVAIDLPGIGDSSIPASGIDMTTSAKRIHEAFHKLGYERARVVGHDIGLMVAYAYAALYPAEVESLTLMDAFLPGIGAWRDVYDAPNPWHFRFYGHTPETTSRPTGRTRSARPNGRPTPGPMQDPDGWRPASRTSPRFSRPPASSPSSERPGCRCR